MIRRIKKDCVEIENAFKYLYGFKIISGTDALKTFNEDKLSQIIKKTKNSTKYNNFVFIAVKRMKLKNYPDDKKESYKTEVYYFFYDKFLMTEFMRYIPTAVKMTGEEVAKALFSCQVMLDDYYIEDKKLKLFNLPKFTERTILIPPVGKTYKRFVDNFLKKKKEEGLYPYFIYRATKPATNEPPIEELFSSEWQGTLWISLNLNKIDSLIRSRANAIYSILSPMEAKKWKQFADRYKAGEEIVAGVEIIYVTFEDELENVSNVFKSIGCDFTVWEVFYEKLIKETPLNYKDDDFLIINYSDFLSKLMPVSYAKNFSVIMRDTIYGRNKRGEYITYSQFREGQTPHMFVIAPTRSGKSFFIQNYVCTMADIDVEGLFNGNIKNTDLPIDVRYFDVGFSAEFLVKLMEKRGFSVAVMNPKPDIKINLLEMKNPAEDIDICVNLINITLETKKEEIMTAREEGLFREVVLELYRHPGKRQDYYIEWLKEKFPGYYERAKELGYEDGDTISSLKEEEFNALHYPTIGDVIRLLRQIENEDSIEENKKSAHSLIVKLTSVRKVANFFSFSDIYISNKKFVYIDLNYFKKSPNFIPIYSAILTKIVKSLQSGIKGENEVKLFICDEFHNVVKREVFKDFFEVLAREAAKYNIYLVMISQEPSDIPKKIANAVGTKVFLRPAGDVAGESPSALFEEQVKENFEIREEAIEELKILPKYTPLFFYPAGYFTMQLPLDKIKSQVFESRTIVKLKTPDGIIITKTYANNE